MLLLSVVLISGLASCNDDDNVDVKAFGYSTLGSIEKTADADYFIDSDKGRKLFVENPQVMNELKEGDRVYAEFLLSGQKREGFDECINIYYLYKVLIKDPVHLTAENEKDIADDKIRAIDIWPTDDYLSFRFQFYASGTKTHIINLVTVDNPDKQEDGYQYVELRHNAVGDGGQQLYNGIVSFNIRNFVDENPDLKGFIVRVRTFNDGLNYIKIDLKTDNESSAEGVGTNTSRSMDEYDKIFN